MTAEVIVFRLKQRMKPGRQVAGRDFLVLTENTIGFVPQGTVLSHWVEDGLPEVVEDFAAERRLAEQALERD